MCKVTVAVWTSDQPTKPITTTLSCFIDTRAGLLQFLNIKIKIAILHWITAKFYELCTVFDILSDALAMPIILETSFFSWHPDFYILFRIIPSFLLKVLTRSFIMISGFDQGASNWKLGIKNKNYNLGIFQ